MSRKIQRPAGAVKQLQQAELQVLVGLLQQGKSKQAESGARKLFKKHPEALVLLDILSKAQIAQSKYREACQVLEKLVAAKPDHYDGFYNLGIVWMNLDRPDKAVEQFQYVADHSQGSADVLTNLGAALYEMEKFEEAAENYRKAVDLKPDYVPALRNLGASLRKMNKLEESEHYLSKIPFIMPRFAAGHLSLGVTQRLLGQTEKARKSFDTVLAIEPDNREAHNELGNLHYSAGQFEESISHFKKVDTKSARAMILEAMHQRGVDEETLSNAISELNQIDHHNLRAAAFSAFASHQYGFKDTHGFAPDPLKYVSISHLNDLLEATPSLLEELMTEAENLSASWENHTTRGGFQSYGNLFEAGKIFETLEEIIRKELERYRKEKLELAGDIVSSFPKNFMLDGWHVKLLKSGHQKPHIHSRGWVSGVFYLKVPENITAEEGAISFSLHGYNYRVLKEEIPQLIHKPKAGELVLFPSSLFHSTIPFDAEEDRQCIAFDMIPA